MYKPEGLSRSSKSLETCAGSGEMRAKCVPLWMYYVFERTAVEKGGGVWGEERTGVPRTAFNQLPHR